MTWSCPVCHESLVLNERTFSCVNNHRFDQAKEGYVNLLLSHKKKSQTPGDNKTMLQHRRNFLEQGHYDPLAQRLAALIQTYFSANQTLSVFDSGCGEGYYLNHIAQCLGTQHQFLGIDISRDAVKMAAKRYKSFQFAVASSYDIPISNQSIDVLIRVFAPASEQEIQRILKPNGLYLWVRPHAHHLFELRQLIYQDPQPHGLDIEMPEGFECLEHIELRYPLALNTTDSIAALLAMTPYYWSASQEVQQRCQQLTEFSVDADFSIYVLRRL